MPAVFVPSPVGADEVYIDDHQYPAYLKDPHAFAAHHFGFCTQQYDLWMEMEGRGLCGCSTKSGGQCRNFVSGGALSAREWRERHGKGCPIHGG